MAWSAYCGRLSGLGVLTQLCEVPLQGTAQWGATPSPLSARNKHSQVCACNTDTRSGTQHISVQAQQGATHMCTTGHNTFVHSRRNTHKGCVHQNRRSNVCTWGTATAYESSTGQDNAHSGPQRIQPIRQPEHTPPSLRMHHRYARGEGRSV